MNNGLSANNGDASLQTIAMLILFGCILVSAVVWFTIDGMRSTAVSAIAAVAAQKSGNGAAGANPGTGGAGGQTNTSGANSGASGSAPSGKTITFSLGGQSFTRESSGDVNAPIVIAEFSDYQCPYCMQAVPTIQQLEKAEGSKIQVVHMNYVVHPGARLAALAAECAGEQGKYWAMHDAIFTQQKYDKDGLTQTASSIGLDTASFSTCLGSGKYETAVDNEQTAGDSIGVSGTPTFMIGRIKNGVLTGKTSVGALPLSDFESAVQTAMNS